MSRGWSLSKSVSSRALANRCPLLRATAAAEEKYPWAVLTEGRGRPSAGTEACFQHKDRNDSSPGNVQNAVAVPTWWCLTVFR